MNNNKTDIKLAAIFLFLLTGLLISGCCKKEAPLDVAGKAYQKGDFAKAVEIFKPVAEEGNPEAQANIAFMYYCGMHLKKDHEKAAKWYLAAARQNHVNAQFSLGTLYENGEGVKRDFGEAYFWYSLAEKQGDKDAQRLRRELERRLSSKEVQRQKKRIAAWKPQD